MADGKTTTLYYRLAQAYADADAVVIGKIVGRPARGYNLLFRVADVIKGAPEREITLRGEGTTTRATKDGFSIPADKNVLLLLRKSASELYEAVEDYDSECRTYFEIAKGTALLRPTAADKGGTRVEVKSLDSYFKSRPTPLTYESK